MANNKNENIESYNEDVVEFNITEWLTFFWSHRLVFIKTIAVSIIIGVIVALILPKKYTAVATILPPQSSTRSSTLSQFSQLIGDFSIGGTDMNQLYPDIATSRSILMEVLNSTYNNESFWDILIKEYNVNQKNDEIVVKEKVIEHLQKRITISVDRQTSMVTIKVTSYDPELAAALINEILNQMDIYLRYSLKTVATGQSQMIESRLDDVADSLKIAEDNLLQFRESNRTTSLSPKLQIYEMRLLRDVEVNNAVYVELAKQLEVTRIQENQLRPVLNVLDRATPPIEKSWPPRKKIVFLFMVIGFLGAVGIIKFKDFLNKSSISE